MKFIEIYNRSKNLLPFTSRVKKFKTFSYLNKRNPKKYGIKWSPLHQSFLYFINGYEVDNSCGKYSKMEDYAR